VVFDVQRKGERIKVKVPLKNPKDPFIYRNVYDETPAYFVAGASCSLRCPGNHSGLWIGSHAGLNVQELIYYAEYAKIDGMYKDRDEFVILSRRLPNAVNTYTDSFINGIVTEINNVRISCLADVKKAMAKPLDGFHVMKFAEWTTALCWMPTRYRTPTMISRLHMV